MCMKREKKNMEERVGQGYKARKQHTYSSKVDSVPSAVFEPNIKTKTTNQTKNSVEIIFLIYSSYLLKSSK